MAESCPRRRMNGVNEMGLQSIVNVGMPMQDFATRTSEVTDRQAVTAARYLAGAPISGGACDTTRRISRNAGRREFAIVVALACCGVASVLLVAFTPWYESLRPAEPASRSPYSFTGSSPSTREVIEPTETRKRIADVLVKDCRLRGVHGNIPL